MTISPEERGINIRLEALAELIQVQEEYIARLRLREERLKLDLRALRRAA